MADLDHLFMIRRCFGTPDADKFHSNSREFTKMVQERHPRCNICQFCEWLSSSKIETPPAKLSQDHPNAANCTHNHLSGAINGIRISPYPQFDSSARLIILIFGLLPPW